MDREHEHVMRKIRQAKTLIRFWAVALVIIGVAQVVWYVVSPNYAAHTATSEHSEEKSEQKD